MIATLEYSYMIFATCGGFLFFAEVPDLWTIFGMCLIAAGGGALLLVSADSATHGPRSRHSAALQAPAE